MRRFRLKTLLVLVTLACVALAAWRTNAVWWHYLLPVGEAGVNIRVLSGQPLDVTDPKQVLRNTTDRITLRIVTDPGWNPALVVQGDEAFRTEIATEPIGLAGNRVAELTIEVGDNWLVVSNRNGHPLFARETDTETPHAYRILRPLAIGSNVALARGRVGYVVAMYYSDSMGAGIDSQSYRFEIQVCRD